MDATNAYIALGKRILRMPKGPSRTVPTYDLFGGMMEFDLAESFPALLCKRVPLKTAFGEMLWMISGSTNINDLHKPEFGRGEIWDDDQAKFAARYEASRESWRRPLEAGDLGHVYGEQWRRFSGIDSLASNYDTMMPRGVDQLKALVDTLRREPSSRRAVVTAFNPAIQTPELAALPPCHMMFQASASHGVMDLMIMQRSADYLLGLPFNIANYALMTHMLADLLGMPAGRLIHVYGSAHIYETHEEKCREMFANWNDKSNPAHGIKLELRIAPGNRNYLDDYKLADFSVVSVADGTSDGRAYRDLGLPEYKVPLHT